MLSIDEAIAREREMAEMHRNDIVPKEDYNNMPWVDKNNEASMRSAEEHEQLAEWLEELKSYKEKPEGWMWDEAERKGFNKAIYDAKGVILQTLDNEILVDTLNLRLDQLKAGGTNDN